LNPQINATLLIANRMDLLAPSCFQQFATMFYLQKSKNPLNNSRLALRKETKDLVFICKPMFSSRKQGPNYAKYCLYSFIRYGDWEEMPLTEVMNLSLAVDRWELFTKSCSEEMKLYIKVELDINGLLQQVVSDALEEAHDEDIEEDGTLDDWMLLGNEGGNVSHVADDVDALTHTLNYDWSEHQAIEYSPEQLISGPAFLQTLSTSSFAQPEQKRVITRDMLNEKQRIAYDIAELAHSLDKQV
jgi:hypothetical protein